MSKIPLIIEADHANIVLINYYGKDTVIPLCYRRDFYPHIGVFGAEADTRSANSYLQAIYQLRITIYGSYRYG